MAEPWANLLQPGPGYGTQRKDYAAWYKALPIGGNHNRHIAPLLWRGLGGAAHQQSQGQRLLRITYCHAGAVLTVAFCRPRISPFVLKIGVYHRFDQLLEFYCRRPVKLGSGLGGVAN